MRVKLRESAWHSFGAGYGDLAVAAADAAATGRVPYLSNCASCQGSDPNRLGALGPAIADSPRALMEERVLHRSYLVPTTPDVTPT